MSAEQYWDQQVNALLEALLAPAISEFLKGKTTAEVAQAAGANFAELEAGSPGTMEAVIKVAKDRLRDGQAKLIHIIDPGPCNASAMRDLWDGLTPERQEHISSTVLSNANWSLAPFKLPRRH